jgi:hypothetical protein
MLSTRELLATMHARDLECHEQVLRDCLADHLADIEDTYRSPSILAMKAPARRCNGQNGPVGLLVYEATERRAAPSSDVAWLPERIAA